MKTRRTMYYLAAILTLVLFVQCVQATSYVPGWVTSYYKNQDWGGPATTTNSQVYIHFAGPFSGPSDIANWPFGIIAQYQNFTMTADGYVDITTPATYTFSTTSDDGVQLFVDGPRVIDDEGDHAATVDTAMVPLTTGYHHVYLKYRENMFGTDPYINSTGNQCVIYLYYSSPNMAETLVPGLHLGSSAPEFPSALVPATFIIGVLGAVLYLRRSKEH